MVAEAAQLDPFDGPPPRAPVAEPEQLTLDLDGWEGPLDLLLTLARAQKVDLKAISILSLVEQYLAYMAQMRAIRLELAADYLVMAAWLTYLKSALLLPGEPEEEPSAEELALRLTLRLQRLDAMRDAGARLMARDRLGRDVFTRGAPEGLRIERSSQWQCSWIELIRAYGRVQMRSMPVVHHITPRAVLTLEAAMDRLSALIGTAMDWTMLHDFLPPGCAPALRRSALASSFVAALELARQGRVELDQAAPFAPLMLRGRG